MTQQKTFFTPTRRREFAIGGIVAILALALTIAFWPQAVLVDISTVEKGYMAVTIEEEGETRIREVYALSAPFSGRVLRIDADVGDLVARNETVLASIEPIDPNLLDIRSRAQAEAAAKAAEEASRLASAEVTRAQAELDLAKADLKRNETLFEKGTISASRIDRLRAEAQVKQAALETAAATFKMREFELETARASLIEPVGTNRNSAEGDENSEIASDNPGHNRSCCLPVTAPVDGQVLRVFHESEGVVTAGTLLIEIGDPANLEIVVDLLSSDAVRVSEGARVIIKDWGGEDDLVARVRRVEPFAFTKVSALGIEEQRVNVIVDLVDPREAWQRLGHAYQIDASIIIWEAEDVLQVPLSALFRVEKDWAVFLYQDGRAVEQRVELGQINDLTAQILSGIEEGQKVVVHPSDRVVNGVRIAERP